MATHPRLQICTPLSLFDCQGSKNLNLFDPYKSDFEREHQLTEVDPASIPEGESKNTRDKMDKLVVLLQFQDYFSEESRILDVPFEILPVSDSEEQPGKFNCSSRVDSVIENSVPIEEQIQEGEYMPKQKIRKIKKFSEKRVQLGSVYGQEQINKNIVPDPSEEWSPASRSQNKAKQPTQRSPPNLIKQRRKKQTKIKPERSCHCKKTYCRKNYCNCYFMGRGCDSSCSCLNCQNQKI